MAEQSVLLPDVLDVKSDVQTRMEAEASEKARLATQERFVDLFSRATEEYWVGDMVENSVQNQDFKPDYEWKSSTEQKSSVIREFQNEDYQDYIFQATSEEEFNWRLDRSRKTKENEEFLASNGYAGVTASMLAGVSDPALLPLWFVPYGGAVSNGVKTVGAAARVYNYAKAGFIIGGLEGSALGAIEYATKPNATEMDILYATLLSAGVGGAAGHVQGKIQKMLDRQMLENSGYKLSPEGEKYFSGIYATEAEQLLNALDDGEPERIFGGDLSAAAVDNDLDRAMRQDTAQNIKDYADAPAVKKNFYDSIGIRKALSAVARGGQSENGLVRTLTFKLGLVSGDTTTDAPINASASIIKTMDEKRFKGLFHNAYRVIDRGGIEKTEFNELIGRYIRGDIDAASRLSTEAKAFGDEVKGLFDKMRIEARRAGVKGFDEIDNNEFYLPRMYDPIKVDKVLGKYGFDKISRAIENAILEAQPDIEEAIAEKIARGYLKNIKNRGMQSGAGIQNADMSISTLDYIAIALREEGVPDDIIDRVTLAQRTKGPKPKDVHARRRLYIDETKKFSMRPKDADPYDTEDWGEFSLQDLLYDDIEYVYTTYVHRMAGAMGLARNGIDSEESFETLIAKANDMGNAQGIPRSQTVKELNAMRFMYDSIRGKNNLNEGLEDGFRNNLRRFREWNFIAMMGQSGLAATIELANVVMENGLLRTLKVLPQFNRMYKRAKDGQMDDALMRELEQFGGVGLDIVNGSYHSRVDLADDTIITPNYTKLDRGLGKARRFVSLAGGLAPVTTALQRLNALMFSDRMAEKLLAGKQPYSSIKLKQLGLGPKDLEAITKMMRKHAKFDGKTLKTLNAQDWEDQYAKDKFFQALFTDTTQNVQETNVGSTNPLMRSEWGKTVLQFQTFTVGSNEQQFARNYARVANGDMTPLKVFMGALITGSATYMARVYANAAGREDAQAYIEERLEPAAMARGVMSYYGGLGIFSVAMGGGISPDTIVQNPTVRTLESVTDIFSMLDDGKISESEARNAFRLLPAQNVIGINQALNALAAEIGN